MGKIIIEASSMAELQSLFAQLSSGTAMVSVQPITQADGDEGEEDNTPANLNAPSIDKDGLPWDARIHAGSKAINDDGTWRMMRGIEKKIGLKAIREIKDELLAKVAASGIAEVPTTPTFPPVVTPITHTQTVEAPAGAVLGQPMQMPVQTQQPQFPPVTMPVQTEQPATLAPVQQVQTSPIQHVAQASAVMTFNDFMAVLGKSFQTPRADGQGMVVDQTYLAALTNLLGVGNIGEIQADPNKITQAVNQLRVDGRWLGQ